jgi:hypothetical protein
LNPRFSTFGRITTHPPRVIIQIAPGQDVDLWSGKASRKPRRCPKNTNRISQKHKTILGQKLEKYDLKYKQTHLSTMTIYKQIFPHSNMVVAIQAPKAMMLEGGLRDASLRHCERTQWRGAPCKPPLSTTTPRA